MAGPLQNPFMFKSSAAAVADFYDYPIAHSYRSMTGVGYFSRTPSSAGNRRVFTISFWIKYTGQSFANAQGISDVIATATHSSTNNHVDSISLGDDGFLRFSAQGGIQNVVTTAAQLRDTSAWYHIMAAYDTTQGTAANRVKIYINGASQTVTGDYPAQNHEMGWCRTGVHAIGRFTGASFTRIGNFYLTNFAIQDGTASAPTVFGTSKNGVWTPNDLSDLSWGTTGTWLEFDTLSALGDDTSGNGNDWTNNSVATHDRVTDSPTNNFCTINPEYAGVSLTDGVFGTVTEGNLKHSFKNNQDASLPCTHKTPASGKWYFEYAIIAGGGSADYGPGMGIMDPNVYTMADPGTNTAGLIAYVNFNNKVRKYGTYANTYSGSRGSNGDVMGIAVDMDNGAFYVSKNGTYQTINGGAVGDPTSGASKTGAGATWTPASEFTSGMVPVSQPTGGSAPVIVCNFGQEGTFGGTETAGGNADGSGFGDFFTAPPSGFLAICAGNLSAAGADPAEEKQPVDNYFQALTYTGNSSNGHSLTTKLKAASWWSKDRTTGASSSTRWYNVTANNFGTGTELYNNFDFANSGSSDSTYQGVSNPQDTSITIGDGPSLNGNNRPYVAFILGVAGASAVTDTSGNIDSVRFTDADAGISCFDYTGSGTNGHTVPHGLGVKPSFVILKNSTIGGNTEHWRVWADAFGDFNDYAVMDTNAAWQTSGGPFTADPTTTMLPLASGATQNGSSQTYQAWAFANTEGMVNAGTYEGNGNDEGTFIYMGLKPAWFMIKDADNSNNWIVYDNARETFNVMDTYLNPDTNGPEENGNLAEIDFVSNGVKMRTDHVAFNGSDRTYVYLAFAEMPFKYATAR